MLRNVNEVARMMAQYVVKTPNGSFIRTEDLAKLAAFLDPTANSGPPTEVHTFEEARSAMMSDPAIVALMQPPAVEGVKREEEA